MIRPPKAYANLADVMIWANLETDLAGMPSLHTADDIAGAWKTWATEGSLIVSAGSKVIHFVASGFLTDFASVPAVFRWLFAVNGAPWQTAAVLHDFLYSVQGHSVDSLTPLTRAECDRAFYWTCRESGTSELKAAILYMAVRAGGWKAWRSNGKRFEADGFFWRFLDIGTQ